MKNLISIFTFLLLTIGVFGQKSGSALCSFNEKTSIENIQFLYEPFQYHDIVNNKQYMLSYDTAQDYRRLTRCGDIVKRNIYLFRLDGDTWNKASDIIKTDYRKVTSDCIGSFDYSYLSIRDVGELLNDKWIKKNNGVTKGYIKEIDNGIIEIRLLSFFTTDEDKRDYEHYGYRWETIQLTLK